MKDNANQKKLTRGILVTLSLMLLIGAVPAKALGKLSPALDIIAEEYTVATCGIVGSDVPLSAYKLSRALGVESVGKITIVSLPDQALGRLMLGTKHVTVGQTISEKNIDSVKFEPYGTDETCATFKFCRGSDPYGTVYTCNIYTTKKLNTAPVINASSSITTSSGDTAVYSGVTHLGTMTASDKDGDSFTFEITSAPENGTLRITDSAHGYYEYTADKDFVGSDSFSVVAYDKYGNYSKETRFTLKVSAPDDSEVFADMNGHWANDAVISCVRAGVIEKPSEGETFRPGDKMGRAEFLALAMSAAGYKGFASEHTGFADDADIKREYKGYVALASAMGIIDGAESAEGTCFYPNNQITRCEAAVIMSRLTGITGSDSISVFADGDAVPAWARGAMQGLFEAGILRGSGDGKVDAYAPITRAAAVQMVSGIIKK